MPFSIKAALLGALLCAAMAGAAQAAGYVRAGLGVESSRNTTFMDYDTSASEALLFGSDKTTAPGDFGGATRLELALGMQLSAAVRAEFMLSKVNDLAFSGNARFANSGDSQPVSADAEAKMAMFAVYYDFPQWAFGMRPYVGLGAGRSHNKIGRVAYRFPAFDRGPNNALAASITPGGNQRATAYMLALGLGIPLGDAWNLDLGYRYSDLGAVETEVGPLRVIRYNDDTTLNRDITVDIDKTRADLKTHSFVAGLRYHF